MTGQAREEVDYYYHVSVGIRLAFITLLSAFRNHYVYSSVSTPNKF